MPGTKSRKKTRGNSLEGHVAATSANNAIIRSTYEGNMCQGVAAEACAWDMIAMRTHTRKCHRDML